MQLYYITDRAQFTGTDTERHSQVLSSIRAAAAAGIDYIQLQARDLCIRDLEILAHEALRTVRSEGLSRFLIHHRTDVALAVGADGVHLTPTDIAASDVRALVANSHSVCKFLIGVSCHSSHEVRLADSHGADFAMLSPVFGENGVGLKELCTATQKDRVPDLRVEAGDTRRDFPVFAAGGVDIHRVPLCAAAGAAGVAGSRLFQQVPDLAALVRLVRSL